MPPTSRAHVLPSAHLRDAALRANRWRYFQVVFLFTYLGIVFDVITTALGSSVAGSYRAYEQNPLGGALIGHLGWPGILAAMTVLMLVAHACLRAVHTRVSPRWMRFFNWLLLGVAALRWLAVVTALMYIVSPTH